MGYPAPTPRSVAGACPCRIDAYDTTAAFDQVRHVWDRLVDSAHIAHPFLSWTWLRTWWDCFRGDGTPLLLVASDGGGPIAAAPLMARRRRVCGVPLRSLELMVNEHTPRSDFVLTRGAHDGLRALWAHLRKLRDAHQHSSRSVRTR